MSTDTQTGKLPREIHDLLERIVERVPWHTEIERLDHLITLAGFRPGDLAEGDRGPIHRPDPNAARNASPNTVADQAATSAKLDALTAQVQALVAAMAAGQGMATPVAVPTGDGTTAPVTTPPISDSAAPVTGIPAGTGSAAPITPPPSGSPAEPVAIPPGTGNQAPATPPPAPIIPPVS